MLRLLCVIFALTASGLAAGQATDSPARIAQLAYVEGAISYQEANERATSALPERPLEAGDRLATERDGRAELTLGSATVRLDRDSDLRIVELDASSVHFELADGAAIFRVDELFKDESFAVTTPNTTIRFQAPGEYRVDVPEDGTTTLTVRAGDAEVETAEGPVRIADGQRARIEGSEALTSLI
ncbi:MAG TPA: FecR domain-containing protein, partial [Steroidobacteraceae bacterium]|nr:FecR domain-containing protein [Steroidobacteraceae bacterium]